MWMSCGWLSFKEAAEMAKKAEVQELWLTHFSPSLPKAEPYMNDVRKIFPAIENELKTANAKLDSSSDDSVKFKLK